MRRYQGLIMLRIIIILFLLTFGRSAFSADFQTAWATCQARLASIPPTAQSKYCKSRDDISQIYARYVTSGGTDTNYQTFSYTGPACSGGQLQSDLSNLCVVACPDGSTAPTLALCTVTCNYTPNITTVGSSQTIHWQTLNSASNVCVDNSVSCSSPLVANVEQKRCDLQCTDGSIVDVSSGAQCPPPTCVGGQTLNTSTNQCEDPNCTYQQYFDPVAHSCLTEPNCVGGQTLNVLNVPHVCDEPICTGLQTLNITTHTCQDPPPAQCVGGQVLNTATNTCTDPVCPSGYHLNAGKVCENDGTCPLFTQKTMVDGVLKCATTPTNTESRTTDSPNVIETTTKQNPDGTTTTTTNTPGSTSVTTHNPDGSTTTTTTTPGKTSTTDCPDCAKESTLREVVKKLDAKPGTSTAGTGDDGKWYESEGDTYQDILQDGLSQIQNTPIMSFGRDVFDVSIPSGSCPTWTIPSVMGMQSYEVDALCSGAMELGWVVASSVLKILSGFMAFRIAMSAV